MVQLRVLTEAQQSQRARSGLRKVRDDCLAIQQCNAHLAEIVSSSQQRATVCFFPHWEGHKSCAITEQTPYPIVTNLDTRVNAIRHSGT